MPVGTTIAAAHTLRLSHVGSRRGGPPVARPPALVACGSLAILARHPVLLDELRKRGIRLLGVTEPALAGGSLREAIKDPAHPLSCVADLALIDRGDFRGFMAQGREWASRHDLRAVTSIGEIFVEHAGLLADSLGLPAPGLRASRVCRDKYLQRQYLEDWSPPSTLVAPHARDSAPSRATGFPLVLKPTSRFSSSGVIRIDAPDALRRALRSYPADEHLLMEPLVAGPECSVESLVQQRTVRFASVTGKATSEADGPYFVESAHTVPDGALDSATRQRLLDANARILERLDFADGIAHAEFRIDAGGNPVLMEVAARTAGDGIMALYHLATGASLEVQTLRILLGEEADCPVPTRCARQRYFDGPAGKLRDVSLPGPATPTPRWLSETGVWPEPRPRPARAPAAIDQILVLKELGAKIGPSQDSFGRVVSVLMDAPDHAALDELDQAVLETLEIRADPA